MGSTPLAVYSKWLVQDLHLTMQRIRELADAFPFYQRVKCTGRPPVPERDLFVCFLVRQLFDITFRQLEGLMTILTDYFQIENVPDHTEMSRHNSSQRRTTPKTVNSMSGGRYFIWFDRSTSVSTFLIVFRSKSKMSIVRSGSGAAPQPSRCFLENGYLCFGRRLGAPRRQ